MKMICMCVFTYIVTSRVFAYSFDSGPSTAHRQLWLHDGSLNGSPWYLCVSGSELLRELNHVFTHCTHNNVSGISHTPFVTAHKNMASIFVRVGICAALFSLLHNKSPSAYHLMTLPMWRIAIRPSFTSIADMLREEFANKGWRLYEIIYIDSYYI